MTIIQAAAPHHDLTAERSVLAGLLAGVPAVPKVVFGDENLRPHHMYRPAHQRILTVALALHDDDATIDLATVGGRLGDGEDDRNAARLAAELTLEVYNVGATREHCRQLRELAAWRARTDAGHALIVACGERDDNHLDQALSALATADDDKHSAARMLPQDITNQVLEHIEGRTDRARWHWPLPQLDDLTHGGLRAGQVTLISGPTRHGKSVFCDEVLEQCARGKANAHLYLNEMSTDERGMRCAARGAVVPHEAVINGHLDAKQAQKVMSWASGGGVPFGMTECDGWSAQDVARDARHRRYDVIAFDLMDEVPLLQGMNRRETAEESMRVFKQLALGAGCHVLVVAHLNRNRSAQQATVPIPALGDIRESGMLANRAHNVLFVWREQDRDTGDPIEEGVIRVAKARQGRLGNVQVVFDGDRQRFLPDHRPDLRSVA